MTACSRISEHADLRGERVPQIVLPQIVLRESDSRADFKNASLSVWCYCGLVAEPKWKDAETSKCPLCNTFSALTVFHIQRTTPNFAPSISISRGCQLTPRTKINIGGSFYRLDYNTVLLFGLTELKAHIAWKENVRSSLPRIPI